MPDTGFLSSTVPIILWTVAVWTIAKIRFVWTRSEQGAAFIAGLRGDTHPNVPQPLYSETVPFCAALTEQHCLALADGHERTLYGADETLRAYGVAAYRMPDGIVRVPMNETSPRHPPKAVPGTANLVLTTRFHTDQTHSREACIEGFEPYRPHRVTP